MKNDHLFIIFNDELEKCHMTLKNTIEEFRSYLGENESHLDKYHKNTAEKIKLHWGYEEFYEYMEKLVIVEKGRNRNGFSYPVILEINKLREIHEHLFPKLKHHLSV